MTQGSGDARMQPLYFLITTAGNDTNSICYEIHQKALDIEAGRKVDPTFYSVIYGADESEDWTDPKVWKKANPSLGITVAIEKVKAACDSAKQNPGEENSFRQLRLNQWVKQSVRWMPMEKWDACNFAVNEDELEGRVCYGGLDLSSTTDITAFVLVFPPLDEDDKYIILPYFWVPEDTLDLRVRKDHVPYDLWERKGYLQTTEGNVVHYGYIENFIESLGEKFNIREIAFDRWGAVQMVQNLEGMGFTVVPFGQGFKDMSPPTKELMKLVLEKKIAHGGNPVLRWNMDNIFIRTDPAGNIKADKEKSTEKIDGAIATIMALDRAIRCGNEVTESVYDTRGLLVFQEKYLAFLIIQANIRLYNQKGREYMSIIVSVTLTEKEYEMATSEAQKKGLTITQYVKRFPITGEGFDERYEFLKQQALEQPLMTPFTVMSLFSDWDEIERGTKLSLGRNFYHLVKRGELKGIIPAGKNSSNIQLYMREEV